MEPEVFQACVTHCAIEGSFEIADHASSAPTGKKEFLCCGVRYLYDRYPSNAFHASQNRRRKASLGLAAEREASAFAAAVGEKLGLAEKVLEHFRADAMTGHGPPKNKSTKQSPKKKP